MEYERLDNRNNQAALVVLPPLPLDMLDNTPYVYEISNDQQKLVLDKLKITLEEAHILEQSTKQQSSSAKCQTSRVGRVTASRFGDVLLRRSLPTDAFINTFFDVKEYAQCS